MQPRRERDLDDEIRAHLDIETDLNIAGGMTPEDARLAALKKFGSVALAKEASREARGYPAFDRLRQDVRYAFRIFRRTPGFTAAAVLSLALGIGAATCIFSVVNAILLRPLPYADPSRLVTLALTNTKLKLPFDEFPLSAPAIQAWREASSLEEIAASQPGNAFNLTGWGEPERLRGARATANLFATLGVRPALGRTFTAEEDRPGNDNVAVIGDTLWKRRFGGNPSVLGRRILLDGRPFTIIGVMPPGFQYPATGETSDVFKRTERTDIWKPMAFSPGELSDPGNFSFMPVARVKRGVGVEQAREELAVIGERLLQQAPRELGTGWAVVVKPLASQVAASVRPAVLMLFGAVGFLLLIACVNVANLLLARAARRRDEMAVRMALGAGRLRIVRQLLSESLLLALGGCALGVAFAAAGIRLFVSLAPAGIPRLDEVSIDASVLAFSLAVSIVTGILFGLAPALESARPVNSRTGFGGRGRRTRQALVVAEVALSLVMVAGAALLAKSFALLTSVPPGFHAESIVTMKVPLTGAKYENIERRVRFIRELLANCGTLPGVKSAGIIDVLPLQGENNISDVTVEGYARDDASKVPFADFRGVSPGYFSAMGIPLVAGRNVTSWEPAPVAVVSRTAARKFWPDVPNPVGKRFHRGHEAEIPFVTVIGVVEDVRSSGLDMPTRPQVYQPYEHFGSMDTNVAVRSSGDPALLIPALRNAVWKLDKDQPVTNVRLMKEIVAESVSGRKFQMLLVSVFAVLALALAVVGIYGVVAYSAAQRTHEIGLRMALGAQRGDALALVLREGMGLALAGAVLGLAAALAITPVLRGFLYGVKAADPGVFAVAAGILLAAALAACYLPARRAAKTEPMAALRYE
ncbi:MAG: ADOP family duplicated permease [Acidobacteriota bacterium]